MAAADWKARIVPFSIFPIKRSQRFTGQVLGICHTSVIFHFSLLPMGSAMPTKRPLCNYNGTIQELSATDTLPGGGALVSKEVPSGTKDGSNQSFTLAYTPTSGSEQVYLNGILQNSGCGNDYTISGNAIIFTVAPVSTDVILVTYWK